MHRHTLILRALLVVALATAGEARAANCKISGATAIAFTAYDVFAPTGQQLRGTISYDCAPPASPRLTISAGASGNASSRFMAQQPGASHLLYNVYTDAGCTSVFSDQLAQAVPGIGLHNQTMDFYTCVPPLQDVPAGSYADTLTVTVNF